MALWIIGGLVLIIGIGAAAYIFTLKLRYRKTLKNIGVAGANKHRERKK